MIRQLSMIIICIWLCKGSQASDTDLMPQPLRSVNSSIQSLPPETLESIFTHLLELDAKNARLVCKKWDRILSGYNFSLQNPHLNMPYHKAYIALRREIDRHQFFNNSFLKVQCMDYLADEDAQAFYFNFKLNSIAFWPHSKYRYWGYVTLFKSQIHKTQDLFILAYSYALFYNPELAKEILNTFQHEHIQMDDRAYEAGVRRQQMLYMLRQGPKKSHVQPQLHPIEKKTIELRQHLEKQERSDCLWDQFSNAFRTSFIIYISIKGLVFLYSSS